MDLPAPRKLTYHSYRYLIGYALGAIIPGLLMVITGLLIPTATF